MKWFEKGLILTDREWFYLKQYYNWKLELISSLTKTIQETELIWSSISKATKQLTRNKVEKSE